MSIGSLKTRRGEGVAVGGFRQARAKRSGIHSTIRSISLRAILSLRRSQSLAADAEACPAMYCAFSSEPPLLRYAVMPVARKVSQQVDSGRPAANRTRF